MGATRLVSYQLTRLRVILDASARRFQAQKVYLKVTAAMRWINSRNSILSGAREGPQHRAALVQVDEALINVSQARHHPNTLRQFRAM